MNNISTGAMLRLIEAEKHASRAGLNWAKAFLGPEALGQTRDKIIGGRVAVGRIAKALEVNPAAAVFGESQVGKSYLVQNLLKNHEGVLRVLTDRNGGTANFILDLNPSGGGVESTSLITRFTVRDSAGDNDAFPIAVKLFSPVDVALTLADSYYSDVQNHRFADRAALERLLDEMEQKYAGRKPVQALIDEDALYEMLDYLAHGNFPVAKYYIDLLAATRYFQRVGAIIGCMEPREWTEAFAPLWNGNAIVSDILSRLVRLLESMEFATTVYINADALLKVDGTVLCVDRIKEFFGVTENEKGERIEQARVPQMSVWTGRRELTVLKSEFTAVAAEVVLQLPRGVEADKQFLERLDILDMPGARSRQNIDEALISEKEACTMLLRGRVGYLFNKYSRNYLISTLLFCHHEQKSEVMSLSGLLKGWISDMIGDTPAERERFLAGIDVPPLFLVGTKFNIDLARDPTKEPAEASEDLLENEARHRWVRRYTNALSNVIQENSDNRWFSEWVPGRPFDNMYLLRDYAYSAGIFPGYVDEGAEREPDAGMAGYLDRLRRSFLSHDFVRSHFRNPEEAWEYAATPGHDGARYIIDNLVCASAHVVSARNENFSRLVRDNFRNIYDTLYAFYHDDKSDTRLREALESAGRIDFMLDALFGSKPYLFAELLDSMLVSEENLHDRILDVASEMKLIEKTDLSILFAIRDRAGVEPALSREENVKRIMNAYHLRSQDELEEYLQTFGYTVNDVINPPLAQNLPQVLAESLEGYWMEHYISAGNLQRFRSQGLTERAIEDIASNLRVLYRDKLHITRRIIDQIRPYVTSPDRLGDMAEMLADIVAEMFNKFVNTFGTAYFSDELWEDVVQTVRHNEFNVTVKPTYYGVETLDEEQTRRDMNVVFDVFENIDRILNSVPVERDKLAYFSNYNNYRAWTENMKIGFLATCEIPKYDVNMNNELRAIILRTLFDSPDLHELAEHDPALMDAEREMRQAVRD